MIRYYVEVAALVLGLSALATLLGLAPASYLKDIRRVRLTAAVPIGLALAIALLSTGVWLLPGRTAAVVVLIPAMVGSAFWSWRRRAAILRADDGGSRPLLTLTELAILVGVTLAVFAYPLAIQHSMGPGGYQIYDGPNYSAMEVAFKDHAVYDDTWGAPWDLTTGVGEWYGGRSYQQIGFTGAASVIDALFGLNPTRTQVPFMIGLALIGAFGMYAAASALLGRRWRPAGVIAALLYAGPVPLQLVIDGSESALAGLALMPIGVLLVSRVLQREDRSARWLLGLVLAGLQAAYPILFPGFVAGCLLAAFGAWGRTVMRSRQGKLAETDARPGALAWGLAGDALVVAGLTVLAAAPAFARNLTYWKMLITGGQPTAGMPAFDLPLPVVPGWLLGTREFYYLPRVSDTVIQQWLLADVIPLAILGLIVLAVFTRKALWGFVALAVVTLAIAYKVQSGGCQYCYSRSMLPMASILAILAVGGLTTIARMSVPWAKWIAGSIAAAMLVVVLHTESVLARRGAHGAYFFPDVLNPLLGSVRSLPGPVMVEGFDGSRDAGAELPTVLHTLTEQTDQKLSVERETDGFFGLAYLGGGQASGPTWDPAYRTVVTRLGSLETDRSTIRAASGVAIQRRAEPFDASVTNGFEVNRVAAADRVVRLNGPLSLRVTGPATGRAAVVVRLGDISRRQVGRLRPGSAVERVGRQLLVCVPTRPGRQVRDVTIPLTPNPVGYAPPKWYQYREVGVSGSRLEAVHVRSTCADPLTGQASPRG